MRVEREELRVNQSSKRVEGFFLEAVFQFLRDFLRYSLTGFPLAKTSGSFGLAEQVAGILSGLMISVLCSKQGQQSQKGIHIP